MPAYDLTAPYSPKGDQPTAIEQLVKGVNGGERYQTLLGATGTGKTFTMDAETCDTKTSRPNRAQPDMTGSVLGSASSATPKTAYWAGGVKLPVHAQR